MDLCMYTVTMVLATPFCLLHAEALHFSDGPDGPASQLPDGAACCRLLHLSQHLDAHSASSFLLYMSGKSAVTRMLKCVSVTPVCHV